MQRLVEQQYERRQHCYAAYHAQKHPFAMTRPRSRPKVKVIKHSAAKPATVVVELPTTDRSVSLIAAAMASLLSGMVRSFSL